ncbi:MAG: flavin reductase family protein [Alphaproteobacteria bacterium]|nr:flavin reductase family protein [Alphaproteobacteria bacterium]
MIKEALFKKVMGKFTTGIAIVTTLDANQKPFGLTINAFSSLSLDPPMVLFCLAKKTRFYSHLGNQSHFTINILADTQTDLSIHFAKPFFGDQWDNIDFEFGKNNCPQLKNALGIIECEKGAIYNGGDHDIILGKVQDLKLTDAQPLLYFSGKYCALKIEA